MSLYIRVGLCCFGPKRLMSITLACAATRSEVRSTVRPYEASVIGLVIFQPSYCPQLFDYLLSTNAIMTTRAVTNFASTKAAPSS